MSTSLPTKITMDYLRHKTQGFQTRHHQQPALDPVK